MAVHAIAPALSPVEPTTSPLRRIYLTRAGIALIWAAAFAAVSGSLGAGAVALLIAYPVIDVVASIVDARRQRGAAVQKLLWANAAISASAVVGIALASAGDIRTVLRVFGSWAVVSGLAQLAVALRRRRTLGHQWPILLSGAISTVAGIMFIISAAAADAKLTNLSGYAVLGALFFIGSAVGLARRSRGRLAPPA